MKRIAVFLATSAALVFFYSCDFDSNISIKDYYSPMEVEKSGTLMADDGTRCVVKENYPRIILESGERMLITCDILRESSSVTGAYEVSLTDATRITIDSTYKKTAKPAGLVLGDKTVNVSEAYFDGGYVNIFLEYEYRNNAGGHKFHLILDDKKSSPSEIYLWLYHNDNGDWSSPGNMSFQREIHSFPISRLIPGIESCTVHLSNLWYTDFSISDFSTREYSIKGTYSQPKYIQQGAR